MIIPPRVSGEESKNPVAVRRELNSGGLACALFFSQNVLPPTILYTTASSYSVLPLLCRHTILYPCTLQYYTIPYKQYLARSTIHATFSQGPPAKLSILRKVCPLFVYSITYKTRGSRGVFLARTRSKMRTAEKQLQLVVAFWLRSPILKPLEATFGRSMLSSHILIKHISSTIMGYSATLGPKKRFWGWATFY